MGKYRVEAWETVYATRAEVVAALKAHYEGDFSDAEIELSVIEASDFDGDGEPIGQHHVHTVGIKPIVTVTGADDARGELFTCTTGNHNVYWLND